MVNSKQPPEQAIQSLFRNVGREDKERILKDLINAGGMSLDHESLRLSGTYAHATRVVEGLEAITDRIPNLLDSVWQTQTEREEKMIATFNKLFLEAQAKNEAIAASIQESSKGLGRSSSNSPPGKFNLSEVTPLLVAGVMGFLAAGAVGFFLYPLYLQQARGGDGEILKWLATTDGKIMKQAFQSGNQSVKDCVRRVEKRANGKKRLICEIAID
jgi:hypothetical protein